MLVGGLGGEFILGWWCGKRTLAPLRAGSWFLLGWVSGIESNRWRVRDETDLHSWRTTSCDDVWYVCKGVSEIQVVSNKLLTCLHVRS
jgi:hypothetical protein